jgi:hypothetical protein
MSSETLQSFPAEQGHYYTRDGKPAYEVPKANGNGTRPTNIKDARKLDLVPSVTLILREIAKPGLEIWKLQQLLLASLTLPRQPDELEDAYCRRVLEDSKAQAEKARERGTILHGAIEQHIRGETVSPEWVAHCDLVRNTLGQHGINLLGSEPEKCFASSLGYGGKVDAFDTPKPWIVDFKTKDVIDPAKKMAYDEHVMQLAAYAHGLELPINSVRALNVFIGVNDCKVAVYEWTALDLRRGWRMFCSILDYWKLKTTVTPAQ